MNLVRKVFSSQSEADLFCADLEPFELIDSYYIPGWSSDEPTFINVEFLSEKTQDQIDNGDLEEIFE